MSYSKDLPAFSHVIGIFWGKVSPVETARSCLFCARPKKLGPKVVSSSLLPAMSENASCAGTPLQSGHPTMGTANGWANDQRIDS